jgi:uncharacterized membrane protein YhaH (DUF805 family)
MLSPALRRLNLSPEITGAIMQNSLVALLFSYQGRVNRAKYWLAAVIYTAIFLLLVALGFIMLGNGILALGGEDAEGLVAGLISKGIGFFLIALIVFIGLCVSGVFIGIKRLHDRDKSGWWVLVFYLLPAVLSALADVSWIFNIASFAVSIWGLVELGFLRGTIGSNQYGPDPLPAMVPAE